MTERLKVTVLKTVVVKATVGSNPTPSAGHHKLNNQIWGGAREAEWARLLSECRGLNLGRGFESRPPRHKKHALKRACFYFAPTSPRIDVSSPQQIVLVRQPATLIHSLRIPLNSMTTRFAARGVL